jgi:hypothetical protein
MAAAPIIAANKKAFRRKITGFGLMNWIETDIW